MQQRTLMLPSMTAILSEFARLPVGFYKLFYETGPEADARRTRALPLLAEDLRRMPDAIFSGPEVTLDETARKRFFGRGIVRHCAHSSGQTDTSSRILRDEGRMGRR